MRMMRMRTHQGGAFKRVRARGGRERSVLLKYEIQKQNTQTRLTPPSKTIPSGAPFYELSKARVFYAYDEDENPSKPLINRRCFSKTAALRRVLINYYAKLLLQECVLR